MNVIAIREAAVAALLEAGRALEAEDDETAQAKLAEFKKLDAQFCAAAGEAAPTGGFSARMNFYLGPSAPDARFQAPFQAPQGVREAGGTHGIPFGGLGGYHDGARSWGQGFIDARMISVGSTSGGFQAALLETGSTAVAVPLRTEAISDPRRARFVFELLREEPAPGGLFSYLKQSLRDLNAAVVEAGAAKPVSLFKLERVDDRTKVIAHVTEPIDRFVVEDAPLLRSFVDNELRLGVNLALDARVVAALIAEATVGTGVPDLSGIRTAITTLQLIEMSPTAIVVNPVDWQLLEVEAVATFAANDNMPAANEAMLHMLYGIPVVVSNGIAAGSVLVGCFDDSALLYVTGGIRIDVSDSATREVGAEVLSGFQTNEVVFRGERRAEIAIGRPSGFVLVSA